MLEMYVQCYLQNKKRVTTAWLPKTKAKLGKFLRLKDDDGWLVKWVGKHEKSTEEIIAEKERNHKGNFASIK